MKPVNWEPIKLECTYIGVGEVVANDVTANPKEDKMISISKAQGEHGTSIDLESHILNENDAVIGSVEDSIAILNPRQQLELAHKLIGNAMKGLNQG